MLHDARGTGARGVIALPGRPGTTNHISCSRAARVVQHEDDWERVNLHNLHKGVSLTPTLRNNL